MAAARELQMGPQEVNSRNEGLMQAHDRALDLQHLGVNTLFQEVARANKTGELTLGDMALGAGLLRRLDEGWFEPSIAPRVRTLLGRGNTTLNTVVVKIGNGSASVTSDLKAGEACILLEYNGKREKAEEPTVTFDGVKVIVTDAGTQIVSYSLTEIHRPHASSTAGGSGIERRINGPVSVNFLPGTPSEDILETIRTVIAARPPVVAAPVKSKK